MILSIFKRLNIPLEHYDYVYKLIFYHGLPKELNNCKDSGYRRFGNLIGKDIEDLILFCKCDLTSTDLQKKERQKKHYDSVYNIIIEIRKKDEIAKWKCPIDGSIIMEYFGFPAGKMVGDIKNKIITAIKSGEIDDNYETAFEYMKQIKI